MLKNYRIGCFRNNKLVMTVEVEMTEDRFKEQVRKGYIEYLSTKGNEIVFLNNFDKVIISGDIFIGD